jgi:ADP-ribose pyrophosphatase YjhB (NUDIX family)
MPEMKFCPRCARPLVDGEVAGRVRRHCADSECGYVFYDNPLPVVAALVEHEGDVILVRNKGWPEGWFGLVSGFLERGESPEAGALREVKEEIGLDGEIEALIGVYEFTQRNEVIVAYHVRGRGTLVIGDELEAVKRVPPHKLRAWPFGTGNAVRDWLARRAVHTSSRTEP